MQPRTFKSILAAVAACMNCAVLAGPYVNVASGQVERTLDTRKGRILGQSYKTRGVEFMRKGSPEFAFRVDGKMYDGHSVWKDVKVSDEKAKDGVFWIEMNNLTQFFNQIYINAA